jgi:hypothetical protein
VQAVDGGRDYWGDQQNPPVKYAIQNWKLTTLSDIVRTISRAVRAKVSKGWVPLRFTKGCRRNSIIPAALLAAIKGEKPIV